jgi:hypothetical protein
MDWEVSMPISSDNTTNGVFRPQELAFLQEVFDGCRPKSASRDTAEAVARRLITAYQSGVRDRELLRLTAIGGRLGTPRPRPTAISAGAA